MDENNTKESIGFVMRSENSDRYWIFASHDNRLYALYYVIKLKKSPYSFEAHEKINPSVP